MATATPPLPERAADRLLLPPRQAAAALSISERTLWQLTRDGAIRCVRIGRAVRYEPRALQDFIDRMRG